MAAFFWVVLAGLTATMRPLLPIDETRYATVAWEMRVSGDYLVPHLNGETYSHKPPLLFWALCAAWTVFGEHDWVPRVIGPFFAFCASVMTALLAQTVWPDDDRSPGRSMLALVALPMFAVYGSTLMFDALVTCFVLAALCGAVQLARGRMGPGIALVAIGIGGGILSKGPVSLVYILPAALAAPWCFRERSASLGRYYGVLALGIVLGAGIGLAWAIPAAIHGGQQYREEILWSQTANRMAHSFAHEAPFWFYVSFLPLTLLPWAYWGKTWGGLRRLFAEDAGVRFIAVWFGAALFIMSLVSGKQLHYLMPMLPAVALAAGRSLGATGEGSVRPRSLGLLYSLAAVGILGFVVVTRIVDFAFLEGHAIPVWPPVVAAVVIVSVAVWIARRGLSQGAAVAAIALGTLAVLTEFMTTAGPFLTTGYDTTGIARQIAKLQDDGTPYTHSGRYIGQYTFTGRFREVVPNAATDEELLAWCEAHSDGFVITYWRGKDNPYGEDAVFMTPYRNRRTVAVVRTEGILRVAKETQAELK